MHEDQKDREREPAGARAIVRLYRAALGFFPRGYRREFGEELLYAVRMAAA